MYQSCSSQTTRKKTLEYLALVPALFAVLNPFMLQMCRTNLLALSYNGSGAWIFSVQQWFCSPAFQPIWCCEQCNDHEKLQWLRITLWLHLDSWRQKLACGCVSNSNKVCKQTSARKAQAVLAWASRLPLSALSARTECVQCNMIQCWGICAFLLCTVCSRVSAQHRHPELCPHHTHAHEKSLYLFDTWSWLRVWSLSPYAWCSCISTQSLIR